jgi:hypothetical protein
LPLALLGHPLEHLLSVPFEELARTPGIGRKKMSSLVMLLTRVAGTDPADFPVHPPHGAAAGNGGCGPAGDAACDPADISEVVWEQWRQCAVRHGLQDEALGRLAPSLQDMTRVIWNTPLRFYVDYPLAEIRRMKTHGEKRIRAILEVFRTVHDLVAGMGVQEQFAVRVVPRLIDRVERWSGAALQSFGVPDEREIFDNFIGPLLSQVRLDAGPQIVALAERRLGLHGPIGSVRHVARNMGLTRARVYQLLSEINDILLVRWPCGRFLSHQLRQKFQREAGLMHDPPDLSQFIAAVELFYPDARRAPAGPLERATDAIEEEGELVGVD